MAKIALYLLIGFLGGSSIWSQEPLSNPTNFAVSNLKPYGFNISFTGSSSEGYLVFRSAAPLNEVPVDGIEYEKGGGIGNGKVFSNSAATFSQIKEVWAGTTYYFTIFAYNGSGASIDYRQSDPLITTVTTPDNLIGNYYQNIDPNGVNFINDLTNLLQTTHTQIDYYEYKNNILPAVFERDTIGGKKLVKCAYSNLIEEYIPPFNFTTTDFSREHCLARSWMPSNPSTDEPEAADYHNLLLTNLTNANSPRSNHPVGEVITPTYSFMDCSLGYDSLGNFVFEPAEDIKGDIARAMFYEMVAWDGTGGSNWALANLSAYGPEQSMQVLLNWHWNDPPDGAEKAKTEYIYFLQGNRNPFIDHPEWVSCINWFQLLMNPGCTIPIGIENQPDEDWLIYPNPTTEKIYVTTMYHTDNIAISLFNLHGSCVKNQRINEQLTNHTFTIDLTDVHCGVFLLKIESDNQVIIKKIIIQN
jgi:endonuclease I